MSRSACRGVHGRVQEFVRATFTAFEFVIGAKVWRRSSRYLRALSPYQGSTLSSSMRKRRCSFVSAELAQASARPIDRWIEVRARSIRFSASARQAHGVNGRFRCRLRPLSCWCMHAERCGTMSSCDDACVTPCCLPAGLAHMAIEPLSRCISYMPEEPRHYFGKP